MLSLLIICTIFGFRFSHILKQEEGTVRLVFAISILDFTSRPYVEFDETEYVTRYVSENGGETTNERIKKMLSDLGWSFETQESAALYFHKGKETVVVETKHFSDEYFLWDVPLEAWAE